MMLIVCSSPIQIINTINLTYTTFDAKKIDLIILNHASENESYYRILNEIGMFNNIQFLTTSHITGGSSKYKIVRYIKAAQNLLNKRKLEKEIELHEYEYDTFFISSPDLPSKIIYYFMKDRFKDMNLFMIEEGTFAYSYFYQKENVMKKIFTKLLFGENINNNYLGAYVYKPDLMNVNKKIDIDIRPIPSINKDEKILTGLLNRVINVKKENNEIKQRVVIFDQTFPFEKINNEMNELLKKIVGWLPLEEVIIKKHPRRSKLELGVLVKEYESSVPFEILNLNNQMESKILISVFSTACLNPKIMFNEEPTVILLFKLLDLKTMTNFNETTFNIAYDVKKSYQSNKFFIPENIAELKQILNDLV